MLHHFAVLEGDGKALNEVAVVHIGLGALYNAVYAQTVRRGEHFLGGDICDECVALGRTALSALPHMPVRKADGEVCAVGALQPDAVQIQRIHAVAPGGHFFHMRLPLGHHIAVFHAAHVEDSVPKHFLSLILRRAGKYLSRPRGAWDRHDAPLHLVAHGIAAPLLLRLHSRLVCAVDLFHIKPLVDLRVPRGNGQHARASLTLHIIEIAALEPGLHILQYLHGGMLHFNAGQLFVRIVHHHFLRARSVGRLGTGPGEKRPLDGRTDDERLPRLGVDADLYGKFRILLHQIHIHFHFLQIIRISARRAAVCFVICFAPAG